MTTYPDGTPLAPGDCLEDNPQGGWGDEDQTAEKVRRLEATAEHHRKMAYHYYTHNLESQRDAALKAAARADAEVARLRAEDA